MYSGARLTHPSQSLLVVTGSLPLWFEGSIQSSIQSDGRDAGAALGRSVGNPLAPRDNCAENMIGKRPDQRHDDIAINHG
jgi:hypothetical protein